MGPLLDRVVNTVQGAWNAPGRTARNWVDNMEQTKYNQIMQEALPRFEKNMGKQFPELKTEFDLPAEAREDLDPESLKEYFRVYNHQMEPLQASAKAASSFVPNILRFAGRAITSPAAMAGYGVGGTLAAKAVMAPNQFEQLKQMGMSDDDALALLEELRYREEQAELAAELENQKVRPANPLKDPQQFLMDLDHNARLY
jgi:hypothetical protein